MLRIFTSVKIQRLRSSLNPQTWVPEASMLTTRPPKPSWDLEKLLTVMFLNLCGRGQLKCEGTLAETKFLLSAKWTSPFKSAGASVLSNTGSRGVRISGSDAGYTMFRGSVKGNCYPLH